MYLYYDLFTNNWSNTYGPGGLDLPSLLSYIQAGFVLISTAAAGAFDFGTNVVTFCPGGTHSFLQDGISDFQSFNCDLTNKLVPDGTYQVRFAVAATLAPFSMGIDNVQLVVPEPSSIWSLSFGLGILFALRYLPIPTNLLSSALRRLRVTHR